ncbi:sulfotransferase [Marilutibacter alkalisoli]|nr:sulfotransferase [Lysobacter alkalisoli]
MSPSLVPQAPAAVGGVGGSGTRLVAQLLQAAGFHLGDDINESSDTLWFTLLFKREEILRVDDDEFDQLTRILITALQRGRQLDSDDEALVRSLAVADRPQHLADWLGKRAESLLASTLQPPVANTLGWKEPNTHVVIERLWQRLPQLRYVHVVRNGVDMAYSQNQNQLRLWGPHVLGEDGPVTPARSLAYWCKLHQRMQRLLADNPQRMYWLDYDALCRDPLGEARKLCEFMRCDLAQMRPQLTSVLPPGPARHAGRDLSDLHPANLAYVRSLGYAIAQS